MRKLVLFSALWALLFFPLLSFPLKHEDPKSKSLAASSCAPSGAKAKLCSSCGFGKKKNNCIKCGKQAGNGGAQAVLCNNCGIGGKKDDCVKCGKWAAGSGAKARLCGNCSTGSKRDNCVKCEKWVGSR
jgi:hypothetical protein